MKSLSIGVPVAFLAIGFSFALADTQVTADRVVVSATRTEISVMEAPQSISVLTRQDILDSPYERIEDILRSIPGMFNFRHYALQTNGIASPLKLRGVGSNRVLILIDGVPQNDNFNNAISWVAWGHLQRDMIERIEVVRGPSSSVYGSEALGGVVHIITRNAPAQRETRVSVQAGTASTYSGKVSHGQRFGGFGLLAAAGYEQSDGFFLNTEPEEFEIKRDRDVRRAFLKGEFDLPRQGNVSLSALYYDHFTGKGRPFFSDELTLQQYWLNYRQRLGNVDVRALAFYNDADKLAFQDSARDDFASLLRTEELPTTTRGVDLQGSLEIGARSQLTAGAVVKQIDWEFIENYIDSPRLGGASAEQDAYAVFANWHWRSRRSRVVIDAGARFDEVETSDGRNFDTGRSAGRPPFDNLFDPQTVSAFSPKLGLVFHLNAQTSLRANASRGFRAPSLFELFKVQVRGGGTSFREANPELDPEKITTFDLSLNRTINERLWWRLTGYRSRATDYIGSRVIGTAPISGGRIRVDSRLDNISEVDIYGLEAEFDWRLGAALNLKGNYSFNISEIRRDLNDASLEGNFLPQDPRHDANLILNYRNPGVVDLSLFANYSGRVYFDEENNLPTISYFTLSASITRDLLPGLSLFGNLENIFDRRYPIFRRRGRPETVVPGRIVRVGMSYTF